MHMQYIIIMTSVSVPLESIVVWLASWRHDINIYVLGSEKIRLMERKMKNEILSSAYFPAKILQNELRLMKIDQSSQKIQSFEFESQHST